ncbi:MAG: ABC transporter substrate-binding protein [Candidatus Pelagibacter sp.]
MLIDKTNTSLKKSLLYLIVCIFVIIPNSFAEKNLEIKVGILLGFTGVVESLTPSMADSSELAFKELINDKNKDNEISFKIIRADTACNNIKLAKDAAKKIINNGASAIIGAACPNITINIAKEISVPENILMISPADTSNELIELKDDGLVFRTTPSKIRGSKILADITKDRGIRKVAISYSNDKDYKKFAKAYREALDKKNIKTSIMLSHNKDTNDYSKHISTLSAAGGDALAVISDLNLGGDQIIKSTLDTGMFETFILNESMIEQNIINDFKKKDLKKSFGYVQGLSNLGSEKFINLAQKSGVDPFSPYTGESYDAAAIIILSNFAKIFSGNDSIKDVIYSVANKPGVKIYPGEITKAIKILREGKSINYEGATRVEFDKFGDAIGSFLEVDLKKGKLKSKKLR